MSEAIEVTTVRDLINENNEKTRQEKEQRNQRSTGLLRWYLYAVGLLELGDAVQDNKVKDPDTGIEFSLDFQVGGRYIRMQQGNTKHYLRVPDNHDELTKKQFASGLAGLQYWVALNEADQKVEDNIKSNITSAWCHMFDFLPNEDTVDLIFDVLLNLRNGSS